MRYIKIIILLFFGYAGFSQITVNTNFTPNISGHIDSRCILTNLSDTSSIAFKYEGMLAFVTSTNKFYYYEAKWKELSEGITMDTTLINQIVSDSLGTIVFPVTIDSTTVVNSFGTVITESPANQWNIGVDTSKIATIFDLSEITFETDTALISQIVSDSLATIEFPDIIDSTALSEGYGINVSELDNDWTIEVDTSDIATQYDLSQINFIDSTSVVNSYGTNITESPNNQFNIGVDTSKIATLYDLSQLTDNDTQNLSIDSLDRVFTISLENGGSVKFMDTDTQLSESQVDDYVSNNGYLTSEVDGSVTNELQKIDTFEIYDTNKLRISLENDGEAFKTVNLPTYADTQDLSIDSTGRVFTVSLTNGGSVKFQDTNTQLTNEQVQDIVGAMVSSNTEIGITVTYEDGDGTIDFVAADTSPTNEIQSISIDSTGRVFTISLSGGGSVKFEDTSSDSSKWTRLGLDMYNKNQTDSIGINTTNPTRTLDINGELRVRDLTTGTARSLVGEDGSGVLQSVTIGTGLQLDTQYNILKSIASDSTNIVAGWGISAPESPANTFTISADTSKLATQYDLTQITFETDTALISQIVSDSLATIDIPLDSLAYDSVSDSLYLRDGGGYYLPSRVFSYDMYADYSLVPNPRKYDIWYNIYFGVGANPPGIYWYDGAYWAPISYDLWATNEIQTLTYTASTRKLDLSQTTTDPTLPLFSTTNTNAGLVSGGSGISSKYLRGDNTWQNINIPDSTQLTPGFGINVSEVSNNWTVKADTTKLATLYDITGMTTGSGTATRAAFWSGSNTLSSDADFYWDNSNKRLGIGLNNPAQQLELTKNFRLPSTTYNGGNPYGIVYKGTTPFIHDFNYGNNGTVTTNGGNLFILGGNLTNGSTATQTYHSSGNTVIGAGSLIAVTTGFSNTIIGSNTAMILDTGDSNMSMGANSFSLLTSGKYNTSIGTGNLNQISTHSYNTAIGSLSLRVIQGAGNIGIGYQSGNGYSTSNYGIYIGYRAGYKVPTAASGDYNIAIGWEAGRALGSGARNILLGYDVELASPTTSDQLNIGNVIYATGLGAGSTPSATGKVGIGTSTPATQFHTTGTVRLAGVTAATETAAVMINSSGDLSKRTLNAAAFSGYSAGFGIGLTGTTFSNTRYWNTQDTLKTTLSGLVKATSGVLTAVTDNSSNWNTAYGWGNHASAGYLTSETGDISGVTATAPITGGGTSGAVTIGITQSGTSANGYLSSTDWNTFNGKIGGSGTSGQVPYFSGTSTLASHGNLTFSGATGLMHLNGKLAIKNTGTSGLRYTMYIPNATYGLTLYPSNSTPSAPITIMKADSSTRAFVFYPTYGSIGLGNTANQGEAGQALLSGGHQGQAYWGNPTATVDQKFAKFYRSSVYNVNHTSNKALPLFDDGGTNTAFNLEGFTLAAGDTTLQVPAAGYYELSLNMKAITTAETGSSSLQFQYFIGDSSPTGCYLGYQTLTSPNSAAEQITYNTIVYIPAPLSSNKLKIKVASTVSGAVYSQITAVDFTIKRIE